MNSFVHIIDSFLSDEESDFLINRYNNKITKEHDKLNNYQYYNILETIFPEKFNKAIEEYKNKFNEINLLTSYWGLKDLRFKKFSPGTGFTDWHSEHSITAPYRILNVQIYLSNHNCGTQFYNGEVIESKKGRLAFFPSYFTHTHRGQICPDNITRYIITGYISFVSKGKNEK